MTLIGCFVTPHPPIIVPEVGGAQLMEAQPTVCAMEELRQRTAELAPDTIVLLSPHAPLAAHEMGVSLASSYQGSLDFFRAPGVRVECEGDRALGAAIKAQAEKWGIPTGVTATDGEEAELDWGSLVPLVYLMGGLTSPCRLVLLSFSQLSIQEHRRFGEAAGLAMIESEARVLYVASGDLSHRLIPGAPVGFDPRGVQFDRAIVEFFGSDDWDRLMSIHPGMAAAAGECGYRSLAVLAGVVATAAAGVETRNRVLSYEGPFGVGYLVGEVELSKPAEKRGITE